MIGEKLGADRRRTALSGGNPTLLGAIQQTFADNEGSIPLAVFIDAVVDNLTGVSDPNHARDAAISVENEGQFIAQYGGMALVRKLAGAEEDLKATLTDAWNVAEIGARNPMTARQSQDIAAELLTAWANATGRYAIAPYYKPAAQRLSADAA